MSSQRTIDRRVESAESRCVMASAADQPWLGSVRLQLAEGVELATADGGRWRLARYGAEVFFRVDPRMSEVISGLCRSAWSLGALAARLTQPDGAPIGEQVHRLWTGAVLTEAIVSGERVLAVLRASRDVPLFPPPVDRRWRVMLSDDAYVRVDAGRVVVEALERGAAVTLEDSRMSAVAGALVEPLTCEEIAQRTGVAIDLVCALIAVLSGIGAVAVPGEPLVAAATGQARRRWAFADRVLHARSRLDRHVGGYGGTFPLRHRLPEPPARRVPTGAIRDLPCVDLTDVARRDPPFTRVLEDRRSIRAVAEHPIRIEQLGAFLFRTAHATARLLPDGREQVVRPYPSAGGLGELELYPLVNRCDGLDPGLHRYLSARHALEFVAHPSESTRSLCRDARRSTGMTRDADVLLILAAYFPMVNWKYESIAYALVLKNVGVLFQTMYLVATAMELAPCALGGGSSMRFCETAGTELWEESSVGEFLLSAR